MAAVETVLATLREAGFPPRQGLRMVYSITELAIGQVTVRSVDTPKEGGEVDLSPYPLLAEALQGGGIDPGERFDFALTALLTGFERSAPDRDR
ncbi:TetR/AcrR family transcriptional regulator C-terminal domain-containing protein [Glycomyces albidus]|uniref:Uncharacterized protein n=1 Tax=Glycomyces albidus TaxID=2656774 RepID=A0A6L5GFT1_9ACTN|nr:TetR/AcrR family transcriptional regulator C-terminal domain-containing protein [Glycomyces albidus]MQM28253.1 hypothetical protein [Glycomyces albidus]